MSQKHTHEREGGVGVRGKVSKKASDNTRNWAVVVGVKYRSPFFLLSCKRGHTNTRTHTHTRIHPMQCTHTKCARTKCARTHASRTPNNATSTPTHTLNTHTHAAPPFGGGGDGAGLHQNSFSFWHIINNNNNILGASLRHTHTHTLSRPKYFELLFSNLLDDFCLLVRRCHCRHGRVGGLVHNISPAALWWCVPLL